MAVDIVVPALGESITEATVVNWRKNPGDPVARDEILVELETDKVTVEVEAPENGVLVEIAANDGTDVAVGTVIARIDATAAATPAADPPAPEPAREAEPPTAAPAPVAEAAAPNVGAVQATSAREDTGPGPDESSPVAPSLPDPGQVQRSGSGGRITADDLRAFLGETDRPLSPAARRAVEARRIDPRTVAPSGPGGRILKGDVLAAAAEPEDDGSGEPAAPGERERRVPMSRLRRRVAERLKEAQNTAAMLTTYNEVDMGAVMAVRKNYGQAFADQHGVRLGFMSFFVKACVAALRAVPEVNAEIDGTDIVYKDFYDIGIAVGSERGLVVPVVRDADRKSFADIEREIRDFGERAQTGALSPDELTGGTFTVSNGGVYGSLLSSPILNPPQSGILGLHRIQDRPVASDGKVVIRPMMYLALSYDHRIVDGQGAVTFLVRVRDFIQQPALFALDS